MEDWFFSDPGGPRASASPGMAEPLLRFDPRPRPNRSIPIQEDPT